MSDKAVLDEGTLDDLRKMVVRGVSLEAINEALGAGINPKRLHDVDDDHEDLGWYVKGHVEEGPFRAALERKFWYTHGSGDRVRAATSFGRGGGPCPPETAAPSGRRQRASAGPLR